MYKQKWHFQFINWICASWNLQVVNCLSIRSKSIKRPKRITSKWLWAFESFSSLGWIAAICRHYSCRSRFYFSIFPNRSNGCCRSRWFLPAFEKFSNYFVEVDNFSWFYSKLFFLNFCIDLSFHHFFFHFYPFLSIQINLDSFKFWFFSITNEFFRVALPMNTHSSDTIYRGHCNFLAALITWLCLPLFWLWRLDFVNSSTFVRMICSKFVSASTKAIS